MESVGEEAVSGVELSGVKSKDFPVHSVSLSMVSSSPVLARTGRPGVMSGPFGSLIAFDFDFQSSEFSSFNSSLRGVNLHVYLGVDGLTRLVERLLYLDGERSVFLNVSTRWSVWF